MDQLGHGGRYGGLLGATGPIQHHMQQIAPPTELHPQPAGSHPLIQMRINQPLQQEHLGRMIITLGQGEGGLGQVRSAGRWQIHPFHPMGRGLRAIGAAIEHQGMDALRGDRPHQGGNGANHLQGRGQGRFLKFCEHMQRGLFQHRRHGLGQTTAQGAIEQVREGLHIPPAGPIKQHLARSRQVHPQNPIGFRFRNGLAQHIAIPEAF